MAKKTQPKRKSQTKTQQQQQQPAALPVKPQYRKGYKDGFIRACVLILGTDAVWVDEDRKLRVKATRMLFGKKRNAPPLPAPLPAA